MGCDKRRDAVGGGSLLYLVIIFITVVMLMFSGILTYSKAYKVKNRIIELIEKHEFYDEEIAKKEINPDLSMAGYNASNTNRCDSIKTRLTTGEDAKYNNLSENINEYGYNYCVFMSQNTKDDVAMYYVVVTFVEFQFPVIGDLLTFPVYGETQILGKDYNYE